MYFVTTLSTLFFVMVLQGCHYKINKQDVNGLGGEQGLGAEEVSFVIVLNQVIAPKCLECHSSAGGNRAGINLETYAGVKAEVAAIQSTVATDFMPLNRPPLTAGQKNILNKWISAGAPEFASANPSNPSNPSPTPSPAEPVGPALDWLTVRTLVVEPKCLGCHSAPGNRGGVNLETYQNMIVNLADVDGAIRDGSMPRRTTLTPEQKKLILDWIQIGAPEFSK